MALTVKPAAPIIPSPFARHEALLRGLTPPARRAAMRALVSDVLDRRRGGTCLR